MSVVNEDANLEKALAFFRRAEDVASTDNFDYAIEMYMEGLRLAPDALEDGHAPLRKMALIRQAKGGRKPSIAEKMKHHGGKTPLDEMLNAEYLLAKDCDNLTHAEAMLKAAVAGGYRRTAEWIAQLVFDANRAKSKPSFTTYILLRDSYRSLDLFDRAVVACQKALDLRPGYGTLVNELRDLSAQLTMQKGKYDQEGDFRKSIKDRETQDRLQAQDSVVKTVDYRQRAVEEARNAVARTPTEADILKLADALADLDTEKGYQEAFQVLSEAYKKYSDFTFRKHEGELRVKRLRLMGRALQAAVQKNPDNEDLRHKLAAVNAKLDSVSLDHFRQCVENYPTDLKMKFQYGSQLLHVGRCDEAIGFFQEAQKDPRFRIAAMGKTGLCFFTKGWYPDAIDVFEQAIAACEVPDSNVGKDLRYNLARTYEEDGKKDKALELYRKLAQLDYGFKDVRQRIDALRAGGG